MNPQGGGVFSPPSVQLSLTQGREQPRMALNADSPYAPRAPTSTDYTTGGYAPLPSSGVDHVYGPDEVDPQKCDEVHCTWAAPFARLTLTACLPPAPGL